MQRSLPSTEKEFSQFKSFKTHDLDVLLHLSGVEDLIKNGEQVLSEWSIVAAWNPEIRYSVLKQSEERVNLLFEAIEALLKIL